SAGRSLESLHVDWRRPRAPCSCRTSRPALWAGPLRCVPSQLARRIGGCGRVGGPEPEGPLAQRLDPAAPARPSFGRGRWSTRPACTVAREEEWPMRRSIALAGALGLLIAASVASTANAAEPNKS